MLAFDGSDSFSALQERCPAIASVCEDLGIAIVDPEAPIAQAIDAAGLDPTRALAHLAACIQLHPSWQEEDWSSFPLDELVDHITQNHHTYSREACGRLQALVRVVARSSHPKLQDLYDRYRCFNTMLEEHMQDEEQHLFAQCRLLERAPRQWLRTHRSLHALTSQLTSHHDQLELQLARLCSLCAQFPWPEPDGEYYAAFKAGIEQLEHDLVAHTFLEYEYLMPGAVHLAKLERSRAESHITTKVLKRDDSFGH